MSFFTRFARTAFRASMALGAILMVAGLATGWNIADFNIAMGTPVAGYPSGVSLWRIGATFILLGLAGQAMGK